MVTAELAAALPVLVVVLAATLSVIAVAAARVRVVDAAGEAARAAARGDPATARLLAAAAAPGSRLSIQSQGATVRTAAELPVHLLLPWLPPVTVRATAVAAREPDTGAGP